MQVFGVRLLLLIFAFDYLSLLRQDPLHVYYGWLQRLFFLLMLGEWLPGDMLKLVVEIGLPLPIYIQLMLVLPFNISFLHLEIPMQPLDPLILQD